MRYTNWTQQCLSRSRWNKK